MDLEEGVGHAAAGDDAVGLLNEVLDNEDFVRDLGSADDGEERARHLLGIHHLREGLELLLDEEARHAGHLALAADERGVGAVGSSEGIGDVDVTELGEGLAELLDLSGLGLEVLAVVTALFAVAVGGVVDALALLLDVEADVLKDNDRAVCGRSASGLNLGADAVGEEDHGLLHELPELRHGLVSAGSSERQEVTSACVRGCKSKNRHGSISAPTANQEARPLSWYLVMGRNDHPVGDGLEGERGLDAAVGAAEVGHENHGLGSVVERELDGGDGAVDTLVVGNVALLVLRDTKVRDKRHATSLSLYASRPPHTTACRLGNKESSSIIFHHALAAFLVCRRTHHGDVEVHTHKDTLALDVDIGDRLLVEHRLGISHGYLFKRALPDYTVSLLVFTCTAGQKRALLTVLSLKALKPR